MLIYSSPLFQAARKEVGQPAPSATAPIHPRPLEARGPGDKEEATQSEPEVKLEAAASRGLSSASEEEEEEEEEEGVMVGVDSEGGLLMGREEDSQGDQESGHIELINKVRRCKLQNELNLLCILQFVFPALR